MKIIAEKLEKKFRKERIFTDFSYQFEQGNSYAITGPNGSGKSSLLKILSFYSLPTNGSLTLLDSKGHHIANDLSYKYVSYAAPYIQLIEEFTLYELLEFAIQAKLIDTNTKKEEFEQFLDLYPIKGKLIANYSSGMRQKIKLGLALFSKRPILLLDEPCTNLDRKAKDWFFEKLNNEKNRLIILASNEKEEIDFCQKSISIEEFKK
ncbi:MAG: hypothetical protein RJA76_1008 [Bacteroidota bacterium]|jgi:ABC-type multidrug transport system ATPase subunit